jgi:hypothetical protein
MSSLGSMCGDGGQARDVGQRPTVDQVRNSLHTTGDPLPWRDPARRRSVSRAVFQSDLRARRTARRNARPRGCRARALPTRAPARPARLSLLTCPALQIPGCVEPTHDLNSTRGSRGCGVQLSTSDERQHRGPGGPFCPNLSQFRRLCARRSTCALGCLPRGSVGAPARRLRTLAACRGVCAARDA